MERAEKKLLLDRAVNLKTPAQSTLREVYPRCRCFMTSSLVAKQSLATLGRTSFPQ